MPDFNSIRAGDRVVVDPACLWREGSHVFQQAMREVLGHVGVVKGFGNRAANVWFEDLKTGLYLEYDQFLVVAV